MKIHRIYMRLRTWESHHICSFLLLLYFRSLTLVLLIGFGALHNLLWVIQGQQFWMNGFSANLDSRSVDANVWTFWSMLKHFNSGNVNHLPVNSWNTVAVDGLNRWFNKVKLIWISSENLNMFFSFIHRHILVRMMATIVVGWSLATAAAYLRIGIVGMPLKWLASVVAFR